MDVRLVILSRSGKPPKEKRLSLPAVIGRGDEAALRFTDDSVSRRHCELVDRDGAVVIRDLGSTNGTQVEGVYLEPNVETEIASGTVVQVSGYRIKIEYGTPGTPVAAVTEPAASEERKTVPLADMPAVAADEADEKEIAPALEAAPAADEGFAFLAADEPAAPAAEVEPGQWPVADASEPPAEGDLDDFFKSLS